jgi:hypothetical protein
MAFPEYKLKLVTPLPTQEYLKGYKPHLCLPRYMDYNVTYIICIFSSIQDGIVVGKMGTMNYICPLSRIWQPGI